MVSSEKTPENTAIADMQVACIHKAQVKWNLSNKECAKLQQHGNRLCKP